MIRGVRRSRGVALCVPGLIAGFLVVGCSDDSAESQPLPDTSASDERSTSDARPKREALAAYRAMWQDLVDASKTADANSPRLDDHAAGEAVESMKTGLRNAKKEKIVIKGEPRLNPKIQSSVGDGVTLRDCVDSTNWLQYKLNGDLKDDVPGGHGKAEATVEPHKGKWKVTKLALHPSGTC